MKRQKISGIYADPSALGGQKMTVCGWVRTVRDMKNFGFIELNDGSYFTSLQVVFEDALLENYKEIAKQNVGTALAVYEAVIKNKPLVERVVTVTGSTLASPKNLLVRVGTPMSELIAYCGGMEGVGKVVAGGPMMGRAVSNVDAPVTKGTSGVLLIPTAESLRQKPDTCIRCAKCVEACPMGLEPYLLSKLSKKEMYDECEAHNIADCIECGCCTFSCPAYLPLLDWLRIGKGEVMKRMRARAAAKK